MGVEIGPGIVKFRTSALEVSRPRPAAADAPAREAAPKRTAFRADIQGLRAIAVGLVALCHAGVPFLAGGFIGVDVFFVISGFLITQWLIGKTIAANHVPFARFYATRARRILPAAALTLVATCAASWYSLNYVRALSAVHDAVWATFFAANIHFANAGTDYFAVGSPPSPIQQFWTLAVEEQFYLVWPALLAVALVVVGWRRRAFSTTIRVRLIALVAAGVGMSLAWSIHETATDPKAAYFSTLARGWELGVGVLLALALPFIARIGARTRAVLTWAGLAGIMVAAVRYGAGTPFPGDAALLPVVAAALVIGGGVHPAPARGAAFALRCPPLPLVGDVSYAFYLWHWPLLVLAAEYVGHGLSVIANLGVLLLAFALSYVTYRLYENPLRHASALATPRLALCLWPASITAVLVAATLVSSSYASRPTAVASIGVGTTSVGHPAPRGRAHRPAAPPTSAQVEAAVAASVTPRALRQPIPSALAPSVGQLAHDGYDMRGCSTYMGTTSRICHWGDARSHRVVVVVGDSHGQMWMPAFVRFATQHRLRLVPLIKDGCVPSDIGSGGCAAWYSWVLAQVRRLHPQAIVLAQFWSAWGPSGVNAIAAELRDMLPLAPRVAVIQDAPARAQQAVDCLLARRATRGSCTFPVGDTQARTYADVRAEVDADGARYVPTMQWLCADDMCPTVVGDVITYRDRHHLTATYVRFLERPLAHEIALALR